MANREVVVLSAVRSAIGTFGGSLADFDASELAGLVMKEAVRRSEVDPQLINYVTVGNCMPTDGRYAYVSRVASTASMSVLITRARPVFRTWAVIPAALYGVGAS